MAFVKLGEAVHIKSTDLHSLESLANDVDLDIDQKMYKFAQELKVIAPQAKDFLYFTCIMMHAAEANLYDSNGKIKKHSNGSDVQYKWEKVGEGIKWVCSDPAIKPYKNNNCLVAGTDILMADGSRKAIEDVEVGDEVITHLGRSRKVVKTFVHENNSEIYTVKAQNHPALKITSEHPFYSYPGAKSLNISQISQSGLQPSWNKTQDLNVGDVVTSLILNKKVTNDLTPGQARLLGYYASEGSFAKKYGKRQAVEFTLGIDETKTADLIKSLVEEEFSECNVVIRPLPLRSVIKVVVTGYNIAEWFYYHVGEYSHTKKLSKELVFSSNECKRQFLLSWMEGDGCITAGNKLVGITSSPDLAWQAWTMFKSIGIPLSIRKVLSKGKKVQILKEYKAYDARDHYRLEVYGGSAVALCEGDSVKYALEEKPHRAGINVNSGMYSLHKLKLIKSEPFEGKVYNFEVDEDHSYVANGIILHNSDIFPSSELKVAYKKWVGRPLCLDHKSDSVDKIRGVIVDTVYDEKRHRVIALCALDKKNYPDLADKVATGVATNVSMGTAVGRAVCSECQRVARVEKDFCDHMKMRTCYGEINLDLSPMELSLVVNGADPKAKVKHILAHDLGKAAELLTDYLKIKEASTKVSTQDLVSIKEQLDKLTAQVKDLESVSEKTEDDKSDAEGPTRSTKDITDQGTVQPSVIQMNPPESIPSYASDLQKAIFGANYKIASLQDQYNKLASLITINNEESMTKKVGYFQGTVEPKAGGGTYTPDPLNQKARLEDKQMVGDGDFPNVGDVEGLMNGDAEVKKSLQRLADEEERSLFREAALKKAKEQLINRRAYFQGTEEPTPGKAQYKADPIEGKARKEDKQMVGASPFPQVGDVEGLYSGDLELKKKHSRAKLRAEFPKVKDATGSVNKAASAWKVYDGDNLIFQASVQQFAKVAGTSVERTYANIANGRFGKEFLRRIAAEGLKSAVRGMTKIAQAAPPPPPPAAAPPPAGAPEMPEPAELEPPKEEEVAGGPDSVVDDISALLDEIRSRLDELKTVSAKNVEPQAAQLAGEQPADLAEFENPAAPKTASTIRRMNKTMNDNLREGLGSVIAALESSEKELSKAAELYQNRYASLSTQNRSYLNSLAIDGVREARVVLASADKVKAAVVKYAQATTQMIKNAKDEEMTESNGEDLDVRQILKELGLDEEEKEELNEEEDVDMDEVLGLTEKSDEDDARAKKDVCTCKCEKCKKYNDAEEKEEEEKEEEEEETDEEKEEEETEEDEDEDDVVDDVEDEDDANAKLKDGTAVTLDPKALEGAMITASDLSTKAGRASARLKLAQKGLQGQGYNDHSNEAHPKGSVRLPGIEKTVSPAEFNTLEDRQKAMLELANTAPKVKKQAEQIQALVAQGELKAEQVDSLVSHGVDAEAVKYWKQYYGQSKDQASSEFAAKLTQEQSKAKYASDLQSASIRCKRAYQLAGQMAAKGMISQAQIDSQYEEFLKLPDAGFESIASIVDRTPTIQKQASLPSVGFMDSGEIMLPSIEKTASENVDMQSVFASLFPQSKRY
jgi:intein/homing endonuclease